MPTAVRSALRFVTGVSGHLNPLKAADQAASQCLAALNGAPPDLAFAFFSHHHVGSAMILSDAIRRGLQPGVLIGCSAESVIAGDTELEKTAGVSILAAMMPSGSATGVGGTATGAAGLGSPGISLKPFPLRDLLPHVDKPDALRRAAKMTDDLSALILLGDPFSLPAGTLLPALGAARPAKDPLRLIRQAPIIGGMASAPREPVGNQFFLDDQVLSDTGVALAISGKLRVDSIVSQGCKAFGKPMVITGGKGQIISSLGGRPALAVLSDAIDQLEPEQRQNIRGGVFIGRVVSEYKDRFGRDDFLLRNIIQVDRSSGALAVADLLRVGQTIQFHYRDARTAEEDLELLLDAQRLHGPPAGVLLCTCNGRGTRLFDHPHHDAAAISRGLAATPPPGEHRAKAGKPMGGAESHPTLPLGGFFAAGEIGPIGDGVYLHGQTAVAAVFRPALPV